MRENGWKSVTTLIKGRDSNPDWKIIFSTLGQGGATCCISYSFLLLTILILSGPLLRYIGHRSASYTSPCFLFILLTKTVTMLLYSYGIDSPPVLKSATVILLYRDGDQLSALTILWKHWFWWFFFIKKHPRLKNEWINKGRKADAKVRKQKRAA